MVRPRGCFFPVVILAFFMLLGCGGIRSSQTAPGARDFHPRTVALISLDVGSQGDVEKVLDAIITSQLSGKGWFQGVLSHQAFLDLAKEKVLLHKATSDYLAKFSGVNFSDPDLSKTIGTIARIDAFLLVTVDFWYYTREADKNLAKVGLGMKLIDASTGTLMWQARHHLAADYLLLKPELSSVATDVVKQMVNEMPH